MICISFFDNKIVNYFTFFFQNANNKFDNARKNISVMTVIRFKPHTENG